MGFDNDDIHGYDHDTYEGGENQSFGSMIKNIAVVVLVIFIFGKLCEGSAKDENPKTSSSNSGSETYSSTNRDFADELDSSDLSELEDFADYEEGY